MNKEEFINFCIKNDLPFAIEFKKPWYSNLIEEYDKETSAAEQEEFCDYQRRYHPDEVINYQTHNPD